MMRGNLLVGQSGGCTAVINQTLAGVIEEARRQKNIASCLGMRNGIEGVLRNTFVTLDDLTRDDMTRLKNTPSSALGSCRYKITDADCAGILKRFKQKNIRYLLLVGGNDTALTSLTLSEYAQKNNYPLQVIALPKTIDNDLPCMDHTPGYGSNARFIAYTTQEAGKDTEAMRLVDPIKIIEVMGRNSGWLVAAAALGKKSPKDAPHLLYFPERPFDMQSFLADVTAVYEKIGYAVVVMSETVRDKDGRRIGERTEGVTKDRFGHPYVDSVGAILSRAVEAKLGVRARFDKPGTIQRMSMPYISPVDQREAYAVGKKAVQLAVQGKTGVIVTLERVSNDPYRVKTGYVPVGHIAGIEKYLPASFINKKGNFVTKKFIDYARPLVGELPDFIRL